MEKIELHYIDLGLNLTYSYMLPMFSIRVFNNGIRIVKVYGECRGLECIVSGNGTVCYVPNSCSIEYFRRIVGLDKSTLVDEMVESFDLTSLNNVFQMFSPIYSPGDSLLIATTIYLSRNTDYYMNTIYWVRSFLERNCFINEKECRSLFNSYQYRELMSCLDKFRRITTSGKDFVEQAVELMCIKGFGVKSATAYLLHAGGLTNYAPIDRHYLRILEKIGLNISLPVKKQCIVNGLSCVSCRYKSVCTYGFIQEKLGVFNGLIQSIIYVYGRIVKSRYRLSKLEQVLLSRLPFDKFVKGVEKLINVLSMVLS